MTVTTDTCTEIRKNLWLATRNTTDFAGTEQFTGFTYASIQRAKGRRIRFLQGRLWFHGTAAAAVIYTPFIYLTVNEPPVPGLFPVGPSFSYATVAAGADVRYTGAEIRYGDHGGFIPEYMFEDTERAGNINLANPKAVWLYMSVSPTAGDDGQVSTWIEVIDEVMGTTIESPVYHPTPVQSVRIVEPRFRDILTKRV